MKTYLFTLLSVSLLSIAAHGKECGKPIVGVSAATEQDALNDSANVAKIHTKAECGGVRGGTVSYCGKYEYRFAEGIHIVTGYYTFSCPF